MSTENKETSHLNEQFSKEEDRDDLGEQELEDVTGGAPGAAYRPELRRTRSAPAVPNVQSYIRDRLSRWK